MELLIYGDFTPTQTICVFSSAQRIAEKIKENTAEMQEAVRDWMHHDGGSQTFQLALASFVEQADADPLVRWTEQAISYAAQCRAVDELIAESEIFREVV